MISSTVQKSPLKSGWSEFTGVAVRRHPGLSVSRPFQRFTSLRRSFISSSFFSSRVWREISSQMNMKIMMNARVYAMKRLVIGEDRVFEILDVFFDFGDRHAPAQKITIQDCKRQERNDHHLPHIPVESAA